MKNTVTKLESNYMQQYEAHLERKQRRKRRLIRRLILFSFIVLLAIGMMTTYHMKQRNLHAEKTKEYEQLEKKLANLKEEEKQLKEEISLLKNEEYVLDIARSNYFFSKDGELIFKLPDENLSN